MGAGKELWGYYPTTKVWVPLQVDENGKVVVDMSAINLDALGDTDVASPTDGNVLYWDDATSKWKDKAPWNPDISARVTHSVSQNVATSTYVTLAFDTERWDTDGMHDNTTNNERLTCKTAGKYIANFTAQWASSPAARYRFFIYKNAAVKQAVSEVITGAVGYPGLTVTAIVDLAVNDYLYVAAWQNSGGTVAVNKSAQNTPEFAMIKIA